MASTTTAPSARNRDEFIIIRRMNKVDWLDGAEPTAAEGDRVHEDPCADRHGAEPRQVHRLSHLLRHLQERLDQPRGCRIRLVQQRRDQARHRLSEGLGEPEALEGRLDPPQGRHDRTAHRRQVARAGEHLRQPRPTRDRRLLRAVHLRLRTFADARRSAR